MDYRDLARLEKRHLWHPFTQMREWEDEEPLFIERADGVRLYGSDGRAYYDGNSSMWLNVHGHRRPEIDAAIVEQLGKAAHTTMLGLTHAPGALLAAKLASIAPPGLPRVFYSDDGSTAIEVAIKMAFQYWRHLGQNRKVHIAHGEGYHGDTIGAVSVGGVQSFHRVFRDLQFETMFAPSPARVKNAEAASRHIEEILEKYPNQISSVIIEPIVQMAGGILVSPAGYLKRLRDLCDKYDTLLICDEVATGFGRTGRMFACEHEGVSPDFLCLGKGLTGGYLPLAATLTSDRVYNAYLGDYAEWKQFTHGHSYTGNPLACAAALANLEIFDCEDILTQLQTKIERLGVALERFNALDMVRETRQCGMIAGIELARDNTSGMEYPPDDAVGARVCKRSRSLGLITRPLGDVITFVPPLCVSDEELDEMLDILYRAVEMETWKTV